jgi:CIC family chloride channel protein
MAAGPATGQSKRYSLPDYLRIRFTDTQRYLIIWVIAGIACGLVAVGFHLTIDGLFRAVKALGRSWGGDGYGFWIFMCFAPAVGGLLTGLVLQFLAPGAAGSGIPQVKARYYRDFGVFKLREAFFRFVVGSVSVGFGMSLGREGPTVHICSALASRIGQWFGLAKKRVQAMVPLGMGAGISAAFNTPMAAVFFVFEELLGDFSSKTFFGIFLAVVLAAVVQRLITGGHPAFDIGLGELHTDSWMLLAIPLGIASAFIGRGFVFAILWTRVWFRESCKLPMWLRPALGGLCVGVIGVSVMILGDGNMGIFGIGYTDLDDVLNGRTVVLTVILCLFIGKIIATVVAYGSGGSGGLFAPTLFIGGMLGALIGVIAQPLLGLEDQIVGAMALLGMGAFFAAVIRCPMTSIVMIWEMTGQYSLILPLMAGNIIAYLISARLMPIPLYDALLVQDKITLKKLPHYKGDQDWRNLPISTIMTFDPIEVRSDSTVGATLQAIAEHHWKHHAYPVVAADGSLTAMVTHHELEEQAARGPQETVGALVKGRRLVVLHPDTSIRDAAQTLVVEDVLQAPVVSQRDPRRLSGIVTLHDIARQQNAIEDTIGR